MIAKLFFKILFKEKLLGSSKMYCKFSKQFHHLLETNLQLEHFEILDREEKLWATKFRTKWIRDVNINTKFYSISTLVKRKINKIFVINDYVGNWIFLWGPHSGGISKLFSNIFSVAKVTSSLLVDYPDTWRTCLTNNQVCCLNNYVTWDEISKVTWNLKTFEASDPNGLHLVSSGSCENVVCELF